MSDARPNRRSVMHPEAQAQVFLRSLQQQSCESRSMATGEALSSALNIRAASADQR